MTTYPTGSKRRWKNVSEERRLRCQATERRGMSYVQCTEDRRTEHTHEWRGKPFREMEG
jgi:hypothetical protein